MTPRQERLMRAFIQACPSAAHVFDRDLAAGIEAVIIEGRALEGSSDGRVRKFIDEKARDFGMSFKELRSRSKTRRHVKARRAVVGALRDEGFSYPEIGRLLDRDHSTIIQAYGRSDEKVAA